MKNIYRIRITTSPLIVKGHEEKEEVVYGNKNYISMSKALNLVFQLNEGMMEENTLIN